MKNFPGKTLGIVALMALSAGPVLAQQGSGAVSKSATGWYVGAAAGRDGLKTGYARTKATIESTGVTQATVTADAKDSMRKVYLGYRISPLFSVEGGYSSFGRPSYSADITAPVTSTMRRSFSVDGWGVDTVLWLPITNAFSGFGKIGVIKTTIRASSADPGPGLTPLAAESARKINARWGAGLTYDFRRDLAARLELETVRNVGDAAKFGNADIVMWSLGMNYKF